MVNRVFKALTYRDFRILWLGACSSSIGTWVQQAAQAWVADTLAWMRAHLAGDRSALRPQPVRIFVTGADEWRDLAPWPPETRPSDDTITAMTSPYAKAVPSRSP